MTTEKINGHTVELYSSIDELPFARFQEWTRAMLIDAGVGADLDAFSRHIAAIRRYNADNDKESVDATAMNLLQSVSFAMERVSPKTLAFAALVKTIDGKPYDDITEDGLKATSDALIRTGGTVARMREIVANLKKKLTLKWRTTSRMNPVAQKSANTSHN